MEDYKFERLSEANLYNLVYLFKDCFNTKIDLDFLKKKYNTGPFGAEYIGYLAFEKKTNELAGYYGAFPMPGILNGKPVLVAQSGDTMTHPKHQGKGLFTHLANITYDLAKKEGIAFVFGFPNKNSYPGFKKKLDWQFYTDINTYVIKTGALPFDKFIKKFDIFGGLYNTYVSKRLKNLLVEEELPNSQEAQHPARGYIVHDQRFFEYKTYFNLYKIKIKNIVCIVKIDSRLWVGDIASCTKEQFSEVVEGLVHLAKKLGCSSVHFSMTDGTFYDQLLNEKFDVKTKMPVGYIGFDENIDPSQFVYQAVDFDTY